MQRQHTINTYKERIEKASKELTKKEIFKDLLHRLYDGKSEIASIIDSISEGAERAVVNIPRKDKLHRGSADTLYNKIIIEFENDIKKSLVHAKEQLSGYLLAQFNAGEGYNFTLIVSDFIHWKVFTPDISCIEKLGNMREDELILNEVTGASFSLSATNAEDFYFWIDSYLFKEEKQKATLKRIEDAFGYKSTVFVESYREMSLNFVEIKKYNEIHVAIEQWRKFLSIAYGSFDASDNNFLIHTYLSVFAKIMAYSVLSDDEFITDDKLMEILDGSAFQKMNIANLVDNDFYYWVKNERSFKSLKKMFRLIAQEIGRFDFENVDEDILKGVYQELIDLDTRHTLGEYYTPDWLCERIVQQYDFKPESKILDPSCGSGSFLRAAITRLKMLNPAIEVQELNNAVYGIDIHPLSVQIAKTNILIALGSELKNSKKPIRINVILANTLLAPDGVEGLFGKTLTMSIDKERLILSAQILDDIKLFDEALEVCEKAADISQSSKKMDIAAFENLLIKSHTNGGLNAQTIESFYKIYVAFKIAKEKGRDSIWKFIVQNLYKPYFLAGKFDYIIGNPPWFTYSSIKNEEYQDTLNALAIKYHVKPKNVANYPHLEIAAIFMSYCSSYFLKNGGQLAFVLPRSFFSADHHDNSRNAKAEGFQLSEIWDMDKVSPLFRVPSCVLFAKRSGAKLPLPKEGLKGLVFAGHVPYHNCNWEEAQPKLKELPATWYYVKQGKSSALSLTQTAMQTQVNPYKKGFKQGATIVPRTFYFVNIAQPLPDNWDTNPDWQDRIFAVRTADHVKQDAKMPWKDINFKDRIEMEFIFRTALSKSILPFHLFKPDLVLLPILIKKNDSNHKTIKIMSSDDIITYGILHFAKWTKDIERIWNIHKTPKSKNMSAQDRLNFQQGLTSQNLNAPYLVLYNASAKDANATIVKRADLDLEFIVESVSYVYYTHSLQEAYYLTSILNSALPNLQMKDFQARGLFGPRHVHKKILDIYFPKFDEKDNTHISLAQLSEAAHNKAAKYVAQNPPKTPLAAMQLGRLRTDIKKYLAGEIKQIDELVAAILN